MCKTESEILEKMGIIDGVTFRLRECSGLFRVIIEERAVYDVSRHQRHASVKGMYDNLLRGVYHKAVN